MRQPFTHKTQPLEDLDIVIIPPHAGQKFLIGFGDTIRTNAYSALQSEAYEEAIPAVLEDAGIETVQRLGKGAKSGVQLWEVESEDVDEKFLRSLIPSIHLKAEEYADEMSLMH
jgi:hypothetical protein